MWSDVMQGDVMFCFVFLCFMSVCVMLRIRDLQHSIAVSGHWDRYGTRKRHQCRGGRKDLQTNALTTFADTEADQLNSGSNFIHKPDETKCLQHVKSNFWLWLPVQTFSYSLNCLHMPAYACMACMACRMSSSSHFGIFGPGSRTRTELESTSAELEVSAWGK
jgi:hypothetical protein